jgi:hypothetical protein
MTFTKAKQAMADTRTQHITAKTDPVQWNLSLAVQQMIEELDNRLAQIERNQAQILTLLQRR